jgi:hypothetical protein
MPSVPLGKTALSPKQSSPATDSCPSRPDRRPATRWVIEEHRGWSHYTLERQSR